jgi:hypothetical protein
MAASWEGSALPLLTAPSALALMGHATDADDRELRRVTTNGLSHHRWRDRLRCVADR